MTLDDGLSAVVPETAVRDALATIPDADEAVAGLIDLANDHGAPDNVTCVIADFAAA